MGTGFCWHTGLLCTVLANTVVAHYASVGYSPYFWGPTTGGTGVDRTEVDYTVPLCIASYTTATTANYRYTLIYTTATNVA